MIRIHCEWTPRTNHRSIGDKNKVQIFRGIVYSGDKAVRVIDQQMTAEAASMHQVLLNEGEKLTWWITSIGNSGAEYVSAVVSTVATTAPSQVANGLQATVLGVASGVVTLSGKSITDEMWCHIAASSFVPEALRQPITVDTVKPKPKHTLKLTNELVFDEPAPLKQPPKPVTVEPPPQPAREVLPVTKPPVEPVAPVVPPVIESDPLVVRQPTVDAPVAAIPDPMIANPVPPVTPVTRPLNRSRAKKD